MEDGTKLPYIEPFVGGGNSIQWFSGDVTGYDKCKHTISALNLIKSNLELIPKNNAEFTEDDYKRIDESNHLYGFAKIAYSFGAKFNCIGH